MKKRIWVFVFAALGFFLCVMGALGGAGLCSSQGCALARETSFLGASLYYWGSLGFVSIFILALIGQIQALMWVVRISLAIELVLLGWQILLLPCLSCLVIGFLFLSSYLAGYHLYNTSLLGRESLIAITAFLILFTPNLATAGKDFITPWPIYGSPTAKVRIFFSPSCEACLDMLDGVLANDSLEQVALFPVAKSEADRQMICKLNCHLTKGESLREAFAVCSTAASMNETEHPAWRDQLTLSWALFKNKMTLLRMGIDSVPVLLTDKLLPVVSREGFTSGFHFQNPMTNTKGCEVFPSSDTSQACGF